MLRSRFRPPEGHKLFQNNITKRFLHLCFRPPEGHKLFRHAVWDRDFRRGVFVPLRGISCFEVPRAAGRAESSVFVPLRGISCFLSPLQTKRHARVFVPLRGISCFSKFYQKKSEPAKNIVYIIMQAAQNCKISSAQHGINTDKSVRTGRYGGV